MKTPRRFLPSTGALRALETLDRLGSATAAARELSLSQSAVSRQLQALEDQLGVPLLIRKGRRIMLTPEAAAYAAEVRVALQRIVQASLHLTATPTGGSVHLAILPSFGMRWLVPRLADFTRRHPAVTINMSTRLKPFNFASETFDAAIHFGESDWPGTEALKLRSEAVLPVCAPSLLAGTAIAGPDDLRRLPLLHIETRPDAWPAWFAAHGFERYAVPGTVYDQFATLTQAALHGLGVALLPNYLVAQELASGQLVSAWGDSTPTPGAYWLVWPVEKSRNPALVTFRGWLAGQAEDEDSLPR